MATALVTGGTSGIGAAFARAYAARGDDLVLVARDEARLEATATDLRNTYGIAVETLAADLADRDDTVRVAARIEDAERPVDILINNAGFGVHARLADVDTTPHEHAFDVMCRAVLVLSASAARAMTARGHGSIVNISSTAGYIAMGSYSAIKAWVRSYSEGLSVELAGTGVDVTVLCPGWVRTEFHERAGIRVGKIPEVLWLDADDLVAQCLADVAKHRVISVPSKRYKVLTFLCAHAPRPAIRWVSGKLSSSRRPH